MDDPIDQTELLPLIEGELDPTETQALRSRLAASDPAMLSLVDRLAEDRDALRTAGEPELPADFLAEVEPLVARPMLIPPPDELRKRYRRRRKLPVAGLLAAAGVALAIGAGIWVATSGLLAPGRGAADPERLVERPDSGGASETTPPLPPVEPPPTRVAEADPTEAAPQRPAVARREAAETPAPVTGPLTAGVVLVVDADDVKTAETLLAEVLAELDAETALVRNLHDAEIRLLAERYNRRGSNGAREPLVAGVGSDEKQREALIEMLETRRPRRPEPPDALDTETGVLPSRQLAGPRDLAPSYETQLELSDRGASHTVAVPARVLATFLERLRMDGARSTSLRILPAAGEPTASGGWLDGFAPARAEISRLVGEHPEAVIILPVAIAD